MKFTSSLTLAFLLTTLFTNAQKQITYSEMKTFTKGTFENAYFDSYLSSDGHIYKVGDTIKIGRPSSNKSFAFIQEGNGLMTEAGLADVRTSGTNTIIKRIYVIGTKKAGFKIAFQSKGFCGMCPNYYIDVEQALATSEVESLGMTREKAIAKLKEAKELFDLGIITKEQFEKTKEELTPIITGNNQ